MLLMDGLMSSVLYSISGGSKATFFFQEPSFFALAFLPFLFYMVFMDRSALHLIGAALIAVFINNLTLLIGIVLVATFYYRRRFMLLAFMFFLAFSLIRISSEYSQYVLDRITFSADTDNLTALVFLSGYERAYETLAQGYWLGVGFQQMGFVGPSGELLDRIYLVTEGLESNLYDGGTLASKLIVEFGLLGVVMVVLYIRGLIRIFANGIQAKLTPYTLFLTGVYVTFSCYLFVRGTGYLSPAAVLFFFVVFFRKNFCKTSVASEIHM
jgi:hypothetical protein